jgi:solute carrier family 25 uncoupling protein 27
MSNPAAAAAAGEGDRRETLAKVSLSSVSAAAAEMSTFPIDALKIRLQLHRSPGGGGGVLRVAGELVRDGGLYRGLSPAVLRHLFYTPLRIVGYEHLRSYLAGGGREVGLAEKAIAGGVSGVAAQVTCPRNQIRRVTSGAWF